MKRILFCIIAFSLYLTGMASSVIDPDLQYEMAQRDDNEKIKVNMLMTEQSDATALLREAEFHSNKQEQRQFVVETLKQQAEASQADLMCLLREMESNGMVNDIQSFWLVNCVSCMANKAAINEKRNFLFMILRMFKLLIKYGFGCKIRKKYCNCKFIGC